MLSVLTLKRRPKLLNQVNLTFGQKALVNLKLFKFSELMVQSLSISKKLIEIIEVFDDHLSPKEKPVKLLRVGMQSLVNPVEFKYQRKIIRWPLTGIMIENLLNGLHFGHPGGLGDKGAQVLGEEETSPPVWQDDRQLLQILMLLKNISSGIS